MRIFITNILFITLGLFYLPGCVKDYRSHTQTYLVNETSYKIEIVPYKDGIALYDIQISLEPRERKIVLDDNPWGKTLSPCWGELLQPYDSTIVIFQDSTIKKSIHLSWRDSTITCENCYSFNSLRNLSNLDNYNKNITKSHSKYLHGYYEYTFTEADYEFAKD